MSIDKPLTGKYALVTGASRGIGQAIALHLCELGAFVIGTATQAAGASVVQSLLGEKGYGAVLDVRDKNAIAQLFKQLEEKKYLPTILVNNAGVTADKIMLRMQEADWNQVIETNLSSVYYLSKACLKTMMQARWGRIINITSVVARMGNIGQANYIASKAGIEGMTRALAIEMGSRNITVNAVAPGFIDTDLSKRVSADQSHAMLQKIPLQRLGKPVEVAYAVGFLASDAAAYITGATIPVNGGIYMG